MHAGCRAGSCPGGKAGREGAGESPRPGSSAAVQTKLRGGRPAPSVRRDRECDQLTREEAGRK